MVYQGQTDLLWQDLYTRSQMFGSHRNSLPFDSWMSFPTHTTLFHNYSWSRKRCSSVNSHCRYHRETLHVTLRRLIYSMKFSVNIKWLVWFSPAKLRSAVQSHAWNKKPPVRRKRDHSSYLPSKLPSSISNKHSIWVETESLWLCILPCSVGE